MMSKRRITGRFYLFLLLLLSIVAFLIVWFAVPRPEKYALVETGVSSDRRRVQAVIMRDEAITSVESGSTVKFIAGEGDLVREGDDIAYVYSAGYSANQLQQLESVRSEIRSYHISILGTIIDTKLDTLESNVEYLAQQLKSLVNKRTTGNLQNLTNQLTKAMKERQTYLSQNQREDTKLTNLYETEQKRQSAVESWQSVSTAAKDGVVSFYLDGYEDFLNPSKQEQITIESLRKILKGDETGSVYSRLSTNIYRLVDTGKWYVYILSDESSFNPVSDQSFWFQLCGFEDIIYEGRTVSSMKSGGTVMTLLEINTPIGPLLDQRCGDAIVSTDITGLRVPAGAIYTENGQTGVYIYDGAGGLFRPVIVITKDADYALISTEYTDELYAGCYVRVK